MRGWHIASQKWSAVGSESGKIIQPHGRGSIYAYGPIELYCNGHQGAIAKDSLGMIVSATLEDGGVAGTAATMTHMPKMHMPSLSHFNSRYLEIHMYTIDHEGGVPSAKTRVETEQRSHRPAPQTEDYA